MKIKIRTLKQEKYEFDIADDTTVADLNNMIEEKYQHKASWQILIFSGKKLERENTIKSYNVGESDFLVLMVKKPKEEEEVKPKPATPSSPVQTPSSAPSTTAPSTPAQAPAQAPAQPTPSTPAQTNQPAQPQAMVDPITGQNVQAMIDQLVDMGFPRDQVQLALRASFFNMDRAVEYLTNGIPNNVAPPTVQAPAPRAASPAPAPAQGQGDLRLPANLIPPSMQAQVQANPLEALRNNPMLPLLQQIAREDPNRLTELLAQLAQTNPQLLQTIVQHRDEFIRLLSGEGGAGAPVGPVGGNVGGGLGGLGGRPTISVTPEDQEKIGNIIAITGIQRERVMEAYFLFEKDEAQAINYLLNNPDD